MEPQKLTPMFEQYLRMKDEHPDALLFFRMGDFYEMFFEDAEVAARELQIALTCRNPNAEVKVPMCGVPHHSAEGYLTQLLNKGFKIAICDQIEDPKQAKGLVKRAVTRVLTPGTVIEDANLESKGHNYLAALCWSESRNAGGVAWMDFSTGEWSGIQTKKEDELWQWTLKIAPRELLLPDELRIPHEFSPLPLQINRAPFKAYFEHGAAREKLCKAQSVSSLQVLDLEDKRELTQACGALLTYLIQTQKQEQVPLGQFTPLELSKHLLLDEVTERNLEIFRRLDGRAGPGTLWSVLDRTLTPMGGRLLEERLRHPWRELAPIERCQRMVEFFFSDDAFRSHAREELDQVYDLERLSTRIFLGRASPKDFMALRRSLQALPGLRSLLSVAPEPPPALQELLQSWDELGDLRELLERALVDNPPISVSDGGLFRVGYDAALDELIDLAEHGESRLKELLINEQTASNLPKLKLGFNKVFGYFFELTRLQSEQVPYHFERRQTLANCERYTTPQLKELEEKLLSAVEQRKTLEYNLFQDLRNRVAESRTRVLFMAGILAGIDYWQALAEVARRFDWTKPRVHAGLELKIVAGRHPVVEMVQGAAHFIPNDLHLDEHRKLLLITGPNMAGKSTVLRQSAIICILAQIGAFVPAREALLGITDRIFSRVGASDNLAQGHSTFMVEMTETARILRQAGKRSLIILDEIGRGTSTFDGLALAWAVVEELSNRGGAGVRTLFATHYHELTALEGKLPGVRNMNIAVKEWGGDIVFLRRLVPGPSDRSYGIEVARLAGVPRPVVTRAKEILAELEKKAREAEDRVEARLAAQRMLPGIVLSRAGGRKPRPEDQPEVEETPLVHPLEEELAKLEIDQLTPLEALNVLHQWKKRWG
jgi:DNA mismatch repair protein MutS